MQVAKRARPRPQPCRIGSSNVGADYTPEEFEFLKAIEKYKRLYRRPFPSWREVLKVLVSLGYRK